MTALRKRLTALEGAAASAAYDHLSDDEVMARLIQVCERLEGGGCEMPGDWRGMVERGEFGKLSAVWSCET